MSRGQYPATRMRRNRMKAFSRRIVAEHRLSVDDLIWPLFVIEGEDNAEPVASMPGVSRHSIDRLVTRAQEAEALGIPAIAVFPSIDPALKDNDGTLAGDGDNLVCRAVRAVKQACQELGVICDVALDPFTDHGHDGILSDGEIVNDETVAVLCRQAVCQADAGCDIIAPSDMMDGRVGAIRAAPTLEAVNGLPDKQLLKMKKAIRRWRDEDSEGRCHAVLARIARIEGDAEAEAGLWADAHARHPSASHAAGWADCLRHQGKEAEASALEAEALAALR